MGKVQQKYKYFVLVSRINYTHRVILLRDSAPIDIGY